MPGVVGTGWFIADGTILNNSLIDCRFGRNISKFSALNLQIRPRQRRHLFVENYELEAQNRRNPICSPL